jgi:transposase InsO family protein
MSENRERVGFEESGAELSEGSVPAGAFERPDEREVGGLYDHSPVPRLGGPRKGRRLKAPQAVVSRRLTAEQRLLLLDSWKRSGLPAGDFAPLVGISKHTLYLWKQRFEAEGPAGLLERARGAARGSRLPELTKRSILMLKDANPEYGCQRISDMLARGPALGASPSAVARVLKEAGYELEDVPTRPHPDVPRRFERATPNQLWQTDLFTFVLKRQNRRVYLVAFMDDHSRFVVGYGLHASQSSALVLEALRAAVIRYGAPQEVLTDNGSQYVTWRGKSAFSKELEQRGIAHVVSKPRRPRTLGKVERFWGTLWRECLERAIFVDLEDARRRIGHFIDHYNFHRPHQGIEGLVPADRFFGAKQEVSQMHKQRVADNALSLAQHGVPKQPFYITGQANGRSFAVHAEGERVFMTRPGEERQELELGAEQPSLTLSEPSGGSNAEVPEPSAPSVPMGEFDAQEPGLGESPLDEVMEDLVDEFGSDEPEEYAP